MSPVKLKARGARCAVAGFFTLVFVLSCLGLEAPQGREQVSPGARGQAVAASAGNDVDLPLFVVMAAINAAGYDTDIDSPQNNPIRKQVRADIAAANPPSLADLRTFYAAHRSSQPARDLSQWISFALLIGGAPDFNFRVKEAELPGEVAALRDFRPLLASFYAEARLDRLWEKYRPAYEAELARYNEGLGQVMLEVNGYLRMGSSSFLGRDFSIFVDLLGAPNQANARSFGTDYYVVLSESSRPQIEEVRHGYLHYVLEPMSLKYPSLIMSKADLKDFAEGAPALDPTLKKSFRLLVTESLIRTVEIRMTRMPPAAKQARVNELVSDGHILVPYFFEALEKYEKQETGMRLYYPDLITGIDVRHEQRRLAKVTFRETPSATNVPHEVALAPATEPGAKANAAGQAGANDEQKLLAQGEDAMARRDIEQAQQYFQAAADLKGPLQGRALYGLALVATQHGQPQLAKTLFQQAMDVSRDPHVIAWANIYMGRISDMEQNRELAVKYYQQALKSGDTEPATVQAAERGLREPFRWEQRKSPAKEDSKPE